jgi:hypothetical protein
MPKVKRPNALKHGAFAETAIVPGEDPREFEELFSALVEEWTPVGPTEEGRPQRCKGHMAQTSSTEIPRGRIDEKYV